MDGTHSSSRIDRDQTRPFFNGGSPAPKSPSIDDRVRTVATDVAQLSRELRQDMASVKQSLAGMQDSIKAIETQFKQFSLNAAKPGNA